jgi:uncharacterized protein with PIN domain
MNHKRICPECSHDTRWVATSIECEGAEGSKSIVETETYYCPTCGKFWDVQTAESGMTRVMNAMIDPGRRRGLVQPQVA